MNREVSIRELSKRSMTGGFLFEGPWICNDYAWLKFVFGETTTNGENSKILRCVFFTVPFFKNYNFFAVRIFLGPELHYPGNP